VDSKNIIYEWQWIYSYIISSKYFLTVVMTWSHAKGLPQIRNVSLHEQAVVLMPGFQKGRDIQSS
jgi:hypothetical protein